MTDEQIQQGRIKIAAKMGIQSFPEHAMEDKDERRYFECSRCGAYQGWRDYSKTGKLKGRCCGTPLSFRQDLNAMHEAECSLKVGEVEQYVEELAGIVPKSEYGPRDRMFWILHATCEQRFEAFLRTIGEI